MTNSRPFCVALSGGLASGKTSATKIFASLGADIIDTDHITRELTQPDSPTIRTIITHFGPSVLTVEGELDRKQLRQLVFTNSAHKQWLENLLHPLIRQEAQARQKQSHADYCLLVVPLLPKCTHCYEYDRCCVITADESKRLQRAINRDQTDAEIIMALLAAQPSEQDYLAIADDVLCNDDHEKELVEKITALHATYQILAKNHKENH